MKNKFLKKGLVAMVIALSLVFAVLAFTACGGAPRWANNPENAAAFVRDARADGWEAESAPAAAIEAMDIDGLTAFASAMRLSHDLNDEDFDPESLTATTTFWFESVAVFWFENADYAAAALDELSEDAGEESDYMPDGVNFRYSVRRNGSTITVWVRAEGNWSIMEDIF